MTQTSEPFDFGIEDRLLKNPRNAAVYLAEILESGDIALFQEGLRHVAKAQEGGVRAVAEHAHLDRANLYKSLSKNGKPQFDTINKMLAAMGLQITITPAHQ
jgi:probable addiction module antidote protein